MMKKLNMKLEVVRLLDTVSGLADFSTTYPKDMNIFPYAVYRTTATPHFLDGERREVQTRWNVSIDIYGIKSVSSVANEIYDGMKALGFEVTQRDSNTPDFFRVILECRGIVDNDMKHIYL